MKNNVYDPAGNLTADGTNTYSYDARGRMSNAIAAGLNTNYLINYQNLRVKKANAAETRHFVYDDAGHMLGEYNASGTVVNELFWLGDMPLAVRGTMPCLTGGACTEVATAYVWTDHLNTPRELTRVNGSNVHVSMWKWDSLPFGETTPNANPSNLGVMTFNHRFPGQYRDQETGLHQNWNREYDAALGRYITSDPKGLGGGLNTFHYAAQNPIAVTDREGLDPWDDKRTATTWAINSGFTGYQQDAFRHCAASCLVTVNQNFRVALLLGTGYECKNTFQGQEAGDLQMDLANNSEGRNIGLVAPNADACKGLCTGALLAGNLVLQPGGRPRKP